MAKTLRATAEEQGLPCIPFLGNGDAYDHRQYWEDIESSGVDCEPVAIVTRNPIATSADRSLTWAAIMIARGGLIKPWIFTEIKERRDWDISSRERLDMVGKLCNYGLEVGHLCPQSLTDCPLTPLSFAALGLRHPGVRPPSSPSTGPRANPLSTVSTPPAGS